MKWFRLTVLGCLPLLAACADCNILNAPMPDHCEAGMVAGAVLLSPILVPVAIVSGLEDGF